MAFMIFFLIISQKRKALKGGSTILCILDIIQDPYLENTHQDINISLDKD